MRQIRLAKTTKVALKNNGYKIAEKGSEQATPDKPGKLRVLLVAARYFPYMGGLETHVYEVGRRLARVGVEVTILTTDLDGHLPTFEEVEGVQIRRVRAWPSNRDYYFAPAIYRIIINGQWDLIHCQGYHN